MVGTMATTAVVAGTATAVHSSMTNKGEAKAQASSEQQAAQQAALESQAEVAQMQAAQSTPAAPAEDELIAKLKSLADLHSSGVLTDEEFAGAKAKLLG